jgi:hypothetical protein
MSGRTGTTGGSGTATGGVTGVTSARAAGCWAATHMGQEGTNATHMNAVPLRIARITRFPAKALATEEKGAGAGFFRGMKFEPRATGWNGSICVAWLILSAPGEVTSRDPRDAGFLGPNPLSLTEVSPPNRSEKTRLCPPPTRKQASLAPVPPPREEGVLEAQNRHNSLKMIGLPHLYRRSRASRVVISNPAVGRVAMILRQGASDCANCQNKSAFSSTGAASCVEIQGGLKFHLLLLELAWDDEQTTGLVSSDAWTGYWASPSRPAGFGARLRPECVQRKWRSPRGIQVKALPAPRVFQSHVFELLVQPGRPRGIPICLATESHAAPSVRGACL